MEEEILPGTRAADRALSEWWWAETEKTEETEETEKTEETEAKADNTTGL